MSNINYWVIPDPNPNCFTKLAEAIAEPIRDILGQRRVWNISKNRLPPREAEAYMRDLIRAYKHKRGRASEIT
jgi:hypothetical protein